MLAHPYTNISCNYIYFGLAFNFFLHFKSAFLGFATNISYFVKKYIFGNMVQQAGISSITLAHPYTNIFFQFHSCIYLSFKNISLKAVFLFVENTYWRIWSMDWDVGYPAINMLAHPYSVSTQSWMFLPFINLSSIVSQCDRMLKL